MYDDEPNGGTPSNDAGQLSPLDIVVLRLIRDGARVDEIAAQTGQSTSTVRETLRTLAVKLRSFDS
ncbi:MAG: helix-turn-helix transcriptional regulator [Tepidiformaceae bacterium]